MKISDQEKLMRAVKDFLNAEDALAAYRATVKQPPKRHKNKLQEWLDADIALCDKLKVAAGNLRRVHHEVYVAGLA